MKSKETFSVLKAFELKISGDSEKGGSFEAGGGGEGLGGGKVGT